MFKVSALGHQGWLLGTPRTHVLVDPILTERLTRMPLTAATIFPPRRLDLAAFPPIDAVLITHEHPDHLDYQSLQLLRPEVTVYLSAHASEAARRTIRSLGLRVEPLRPGVPCTIGDFAVLPLAPDVIGEPGENEVDVVPLLIRDHAGHGNFFTSIDIVQTPAMASEVRRHIDRPVAWTHANNAFDQAAHLEWLARPTDHVAYEARSVAERYLSLFNDWGHPEVFLVNGDGVSLGGDLARLNPHVFPVSSDALVATLQSMLPGHSFAAVRPGTTAEFRDGELVSLTADLPFLSTEPEAEWPVRGGARADGSTLRTFAPGTGHTTVTRAQELELEAALNEFGRFLFARASYRGICRVMAERDHPSHLKQTFALSLRNGSTQLVFEYQPTECAFVRVTCDDARAAYVAGGEFWASDVLAALTFDALADDLFHFGRKLLWNAAPHVFRCDLDTELQLFAHSLRAPRELERLFRSCLAVDCAPILRAPTSSERSEAVAARPPQRSPKRRPVPALISGHGLEGATTTSLPDDTRAAVLDETELRFSAALSAVSGAAGWRLLTARQSGAVLRASLASPYGDVDLTIAPASELRRHYRIIGALACAYRPGSLSADALSALDRIIDAFSALLESH